MKRAECRIAFLAFLVLVFVTGHAASAFDVSLQGFLQANYSADARAANPDGGDFKLAEERLQLKLDGSHGPFRLLMKTDAFYDHVDGRPDLELREGYLDYAAEGWDLRVGRQIMTWGIGDLLFINDIFPKDFGAFFSGRPLEYLKKGIDGAKAGFYPGPVSFELVVIPFFERNKLPDPQRHFLFDPFPPEAARDLKKPSVRLDNTELALRAYGTLAGMDISLYAYRGFSRQPSARPDDPVAPANVSLFFPELSVYGFSLQGRALNGVLGFEGGYYDSRQDRSGSDPSVPNSQTRFLVSYQRQLWEDFTIAVQGYGEYMHDYGAYARSLPAGFPGERRLREIMTARLTQLLRHQTVRLSAFVLYSPSDGDSLINPEVKYDISDRVWTALGCNIFSGKKTSFFGQLNRNDNVYLQVRYAF